MALLDIDAIDEELSSLSKRLEIIMGALNVQGRASLLEGEVAQVLADTSDLDFDH